MWFWWIIACVCVCVCMWACGCMWLPQLFIMKWQPDKLWLEWLHRLPDPTSRSVFPDWLFLSDATHDGNRVCSRGFWGGLHHQSCHVNYSKYTIKLQLRMCAHWCVFVSWIAVMSQYFLARLTKIINSDVGGNPFGWHVQALLVSSPGCLLWLFFMISPRPYGERPIKSKRW